MNLTPEQLKDGDDSSDNGKKDQDHINSRVYNKRVIKILQKHFLNRIPHPYINKQDNAKISEETGLNKQQVLSWFTNIRKRKY